jgi:hypothetical protein
MQVLNTFSLPSFITGPGSGNVSSFDSWGSNLSLVSAIETMRIDIVVSEFGKTSDKKKAKSSSSSSSSSSAGGNKGSKNHGNFNFFFSQINNISGNSY